MAANRLDQLIANWEPRLRAAFLQAIYNLRNAAQIGLIAEMLEKGDVDGAIRAVGLDPVNFRPFDVVLSKAFEDGGNFAANIIPMVLKAGVPITIRFDVRNPRAEAWLRDHSAALVRDVLDDQRGAIRKALLAGQEKGLNPRTTALDLIGRINATMRRREGGIVGLTESQTQWVTDYADELEKNSPAALDRVLRDRRFDKSIQSAIRDGKPLSAELRAKMVASYKNRALSFRADGIARTETLTALHVAQDEAMQQAIDKGAVQPNLITKTWRTVRDNRVRETHREMDGQEITFDASFVSPSGAQLRFPGDPQAPASERVNCRCFVMQKIAQRAA